MTQMKASTTMCGWSGIVRPLALLWLLSAVSGFHLQQQQQQQQQQQRPSTTCARPLRHVHRSRVVRYNFFKDMIDGAFANDRNLPKDLGEAQYDKPGEEFLENEAATLTATQQLWRQTQRNDGISPAMIAGTTVDASVFLSGVPSKDPSNDLYGNKVNISSRDKATGLAVPEQPTATFRVEFLENGDCQASASEFTSGKKVGEWKLSDDGKSLRFSIDVLGYTRTVQTTGSIQKIYWSNEDEKTTQTSSSYSIPPGWVYGDISVDVGKRPGLLDFGSSGVLRIEKSMGLLGAASKMVACGKFSVALVMAES
uniref:Plastid lipid-associated protein/fibrillin conserved domain-containing protein n=1 Tax=Craspedostauros australis TaxID=1486917 RepID=A0A7R9ZJ61_9STRA|eukprot:CAMPEP_0198111262 /NCGR_PEP_ID=MMETSP1442-20131203/3240_1 /TAXON_ID= /ORGANISM="Craspedostauros australis, Strain CCMP3328" /LENGTH=310 /DNA_ID=CAMNT_0043767637 /DNA_START=15 /DNA_END=947 /DNA_ORIENTATION=+